MRQARHRRLKSRPCSTRLHQIRRFSLTLRLRSILTSKVYALPVGIRLTRYSDGR